MKPLLPLVCLWLTASAALAAPRVVTLAGTLTNTTEEVSATATLVLTINGEKITAQLKTEKPLNGTGALEGRLLGSWCELSGKLAEGVVMQLRGVINERDLRGTYIAVTPGSLLQYGKFELARTEVAAPAAPKK